MKTLFPPQETHVACMLAAILSNHAAIDSSKTGSGKTLCAIELAKRLRAPMLIVCPKPAITGWQREAEGQSAEVVGIINYEKLRTGKTPYGKWVGGKFVWALLPTTLVVFDEVHACKGTYTQNAKMLIGAKPFRVVMLSATAVENPTEMRAIGFLLNLHRLHDFYSWAIRHGCVTNHWDALEFPEGARKHLVALNRMIYPSRGSQLSREDMAAFFTRSHIVYDPVTFAAIKDITRAYSDVGEFLEAIYSAEGEESESLEGNPAEAMIALLRARQKVELLKLPELADMITNLLEEGNSVAVFLNFNDSIRALGEIMRKRDVKFGVVWGESTKDRTEVIDDFQHDRSHVIICNTAAGGASISLHHQATSTRPRASIISPDFNAKTMEQVLGRIDRAGALSPTTQYVVLAAGTVEEKVMSRVKIKIDNLRALHEKRLVKPTPETTPAPMPPAITTSLVAEEPAHIPLIEETPPPFDVIEPEPVVDPLPAESLPLETTVESVAERAHAEYGPSKLEDIAICPGYVGTPSAPGMNAAAESGTRCHAAVETRSLVGLSEEETMLSEMAIGYEDEVIAGAAHVYREIRVEVLDQFGFLDTLCIMPDGQTAHIIDYKFGKVMVRSADKNLQGKAYVVGVFKRFPGLDNITVHFPMPRLDHITTHVFLRGDLPKLRRELELIIERAKHTKSIFDSDEVIPLLNPLSESCDYCGNRLRCRALAAHVITVAGKLGVKELPKDPVVTLADVRDPQETGILLRMASIVEKWVADIKAWALQQALVDDIIPEGFTLVEASSPRKVTSPVLAFDALNERLSMEDILSTTTGCSISKLEELWAKHAKRGTKQSEKDRMGDLLSDVGAISSDGKYHKLVPVKTKS
jgi:hypothetical protein